MLAETQAIDSPRHLEDRHGVRLQVGTWQGRSVLVKTLLSCNDAVAARFRHEASVTAALDSPRVSRLCAVTPNQLIFEHTQGHMLREALTAPLPGEQAGQVVAGLLEAVCYIHGRGVVHQDIKPENILLSLGQPARDHVVLLDYDLSHAAYSLSQFEPELRLGTPHYMAPEQFAGVRGNLRSDLYAVGAVLHDCLTAQPPTKMPWAGCWAGCLPGSSGMCPPNFCRC
ncbi:serine/threonine-protein kinase [Deinococcus lacus]|uniref:Serine/threonine-protein kinase n=1 Tax=Deinococcus lacus TaxID=392561 RepID=A0ABW1Y922_9DEIO